MPVVLGGDTLPSPVGIGLTDLPNIGGRVVAPLKYQELVRRKKIPLGWYGRICPLIGIVSDAGTGGARGATGPPNIWQIS